MEVSLVFKEVTHSMLRWHLHGLMVWELDT
jgi:hypothetical protein